MTTNAGVFRSFLKEAAKNNERSQYWKTIVQSLHDGIVSLDRLVGGTRIKEALGITRSVMHRKNQVIQSESIRYRKDGTPVDVSITASPILNLWNRANIMRFLEENLERGKREKQPVSAIMVDIDNFKRTNDTCGHFAGDIVLIQVAKRLERGLRKYDKIGRYGGDEMLVVLPGCGLHEAGEIAERLRLSVDGERIRLPTGELEISVTLGCSSSADFSLPTPEALVQASDAALYRGKKWGKNCVVAEIGHTIKGSSANLSLLFLWEQAYKLEKAGKTGDLIKARASLAALGTEFRKLTVFLATRVA